MSEPVASLGGVWLPFPFFLAVARSLLPLTMALRKASSYEKASIQVGHTVGGSQGTPSRKSVVHSKQVVCFEYEATVLLHSSFEQINREVPPAICELQHHKYASEDTLCSKGGGSLVSSNRLLIVEPSLTLTIWSGCG